jgi:hypothetical protein
MRQPFTFAFIPPRFPHALPGTPSRDLVSGTDRAFVKGPFHGARWFSPQGPCHLVAGTLTGRLSRDHQDRVPGLCHSNVVTATLAHLEPRHRNVKGILWLGPRYRKRVAGTLSREPRHGNLGIGTLSRRPCQRDLRQRVLCHREPVTGTPSQAFGTGPRELLPEGTSQRDLVTGTFSEGPCQRDMNGDLSHCHGATLRETCRGDFVTGISSKGPCDLAPGNVSRGLCHGDLGIGTLSWRPCHRDLRQFCQRDPATGPRHGDLDSGTLARGDASPLGPFHRAIVRGNLTCHKDVVTGTLSKGLCHRGVVKGTSSKGPHSGKRIAGTLSVMKIVP